jgi:hypothetical protein
MAAVPMNRMNRTEFFDKLSGLDEQRLKTALWNLYWRGTAPMRERIEVELQSTPIGQPRRPAAAPADPAMVRDEVIQFVTLARSGAYMGGDRRVSPRQRTQWRTEFARLATDAREALRAPEPDPAADALEQLIGLARGTKDHDYFRSDDPMEAARFVCRTQPACCRDTAGTGTGSKRSPRPPHRNWCDGSHATDGPAVASARSPRRRPRWPRS